LTSTAVFGYIIFFTIYIFHLWIPIRGGDTRTLNSASRLMLTGVLLLSASLSCEQSDTRRMAERFGAMKGKSEITVVLVGDTISDPNSSMTGSSWGRLLKALLADYMGSRISLINSIQPDLTFHNALRHMQEDIISYRPDVVIVMLGSNDAASPELSSEAFKNITEAFFAALRKEDILTLVVTSTGYRDAAPGDGKSEELYDFNKIVSLQARMQHCPVIDAAGMMDDLLKKDPDTYRSLFVDPMHLSEKGKERLAEFVFDSIRKVTDKGK
jgi:lysophospholipase L1-like esterase